MAVATTGAIYKSLSFDGMESRNFGVYITGEAVYNAPGRDVKMVEIPGRNGSFALDKGRFQNIEVSYPAGIFADNEADFAEAISDFRNFLCSRRGYVRLTDEYNPNEYRMAIYKSGLEVSPAQLKAGEFTIVFDCKPQRWLTSGETAVTVANNGTLTNPTLFESSPLLAVKGYGTIGFNGYEIELDNAVMGEIEICSKQEWTSQDKTITLDYSLLNNGDEITTGRMLLQFMIYAPAIAKSSVTTADSSADFATAFTVVNPNNSASFCIVTTTLSSFDFTMGATATKTNTVTVTGTAHSQSFTVTCDITVTVSSNTIDIHRVTASSAVVSNIKSGSSSLNPCTAYSTISILGNPTYIDCDLGEAYMFKDGAMVSLNQNIDLGSDLPKLASGANVITYDNTITELKVTPNWWKV